MKTRRTKTDGNTRRTLRTTQTKPTRKWLLPLAYKPMRGDAEPVETTT